MDILMLGLNYFVQFCFNYILINCIIMQSFTTTLTFLLKIIQYFHLNYVSSAIFHYQYAIKYPELR